MSQELFYRTEDLRLEEVSQYFVETAADRRTIEAIKGRSPVILRGSRGVGKSFLLRVAEAEMKRDFRENAVLPVYVTFARAGLIRQTEAGFLPWMVAKVSSAIKRAVTAYGLQMPAESALALLTQERTIGTIGRASLNQIEGRFEEFWRSGESVVGAETVPDPEVLRTAVEELCEDIGVRRVALLVDEAAHVFIPEQQRQFFTFMRDLRSPSLSVKAAVYPGATSYGESFQPSHDATVIDVERPVTDDGYAAAMRDIVLKQDPELSKAITSHGETFDVLAFAASGNPRILLKTLARSLPFNRARVQSAIREYYREEIWAEHSTLAERYPGHRPLIDWGRRFLESDVLPAMHARNHPDTEMSSAIWVHRDAPQVVHEALRLLCYSGILQEGVSGIRATRSEVGTRYLVNLGCNIAQDAEPVAYGARVRHAFDIRRMQEFGGNHAAYRLIQSISLETLQSDGNAALQARLQAPADSLDLTQFQKQKLVELQLLTIGDVLASTEETFQTLYYIGPLRSRQMRNAAITAVIEYLSG